MTRNAIRLPILVTVGLIGVLLAGCGGRARKAPAALPAPVTTPVETGVQLDMKDGRITLMDEGKRIWTAESGNMTASADARTVELQAVSCWLYRDGRETLQVRAGSGRAVILQDNAVRVELSGQVQAHEPERNLRLTAEALTWTSATGQIDATLVHWQGMGVSHRADSAELSTDLTEAVFSGRVQTRVPGE